MANISKSLRTHVSLLLAVKNGLPQLKATIDGLLRQTYRHFELVVQDSCSTDGAIAYLHSLDTFFPIRTVSKPDCSLVEGYARAMQRCTGDLVVAIACDEVLDDNALETYVSWCRKDPEAIYIYGGMRLVDSNGRLVEVFQPKPFKLLDYIRHQPGSCPTLAGVFNRTLIGPEFYLDQTLSSVPDFEMFVRFALRFGEHRLVCKEAITMTASATPISMSFRPTTTMQFERDKLIVMQRILSGDLHDEFIEFLRTDLQFNLFTAFADRVYSLSGETDLTRRYIKLASEMRPHDPSLQRFAHASRHFTWDKREQRLQQVSNVQPIKPPPAAALLHSVDVQTGVVVNDDWASSGASASNQGNRVRIKTPAGPWQYAAVLPIPSGILDLERTWVWLKVHVNRTRGRPMLSLFDARRNEIVRERAAEAENGANDLYFDVFSNSQDHVLIRNSSIPQTSEIEIESVELWTCSKPAECDAAVRSSGDATVSGT